MYKFGFSIKFFFFFFFSYAFPLNYLVSTTLILNIHVTRFLASSILTPALFILLSITSNHLFFGIRLPLFSITHISFTNLTASISYFLKTRPSHLNLFSRILSTIEAIPILPHIYLFTILFSLI